MSKSRYRHPEEERRASVIRTRKIAGQLGAIERMLSKDQDCTEILTQIVSARRGLKSLAQKLIHSHAQHCIENAQNPTENASSDSSESTDISQLFQRLKPQERELLWLAYVEGNDHKEIARMLGLKEKSIRVLLFRARQKLAGIIQKQP